MNTNVSNSFIDSVLEKATIDYQDERVQRFVDIKQNIHDADIEELWEMAIELDALNYTFKALMQVDKFRAENNSIMELTQRESQIAKQLKAIN